jgi:hypothetical protein
VNEDDEKLAICRMVRYLHPEDQFLVSDWRTKLAMASGCRDKEAVILYRE